MRSAAFVGTAIVAAALSTTGSGQVAPASAQQQQSSAPLPADLVVALQRDLNMTPQEYLDRAAAAQRVAAYASELRRSDSGGVGGAWLAPDGTPTVAVTTQAAADRVAAAGYRAQMVPLSTSGLEIAPAVPNRRSAPPPRFHVATGTTPIGGDAYITAAQPLASAPSYLICSFGFAAADTAGNPVALSAGHCDPNRPAAGTPDAAGVYEPKIGDFRNSRAVGSFAESGIGDEGGNLDYSVIRLASDAVTTTGLGQPTVRGGNGSTLTITGIAVPVSGAPACKSGQTSGYTCGTIDYADYNTVLGGDGGESWNVRGFSTTACTLGGDSGGAIVTGTLALGVTSGSSVSHYRDCATAESENPEGVMSFGIPVQAVLARVNQSSDGCVTLRTAANPAGVSDPNCEIETIPAPVPTPTPAPSSGSGSLSFGS